MDAWPPALPAPGTAAPAIAVPGIAALVTAVPGTKVLVTGVPAIAAPATEAPWTAAPATAAPVIAVPVIAVREIAVPGTAARVRGSAAPALLHRWTAQTARATERMETGRATRTGISGLPPTAPAYNETTKIQEASRRSAA